MVAFYTTAYILVSSPDPLLRLFSLSLSLLQDALPLLVQNQTTDSSLFLLHPSVAHTGAQCQFYLGSGKAFAEHTQLKQFSMGDRQDEAKQPALQ